MKKTIFASVLIASAAMTSCGISAQQPKTETDSVGYAVGVFIGDAASARVDSTYDVSVVKRAIADIHGMSAKERQLYLLAAQIANDAFTNVDSTIAPGTIVAGVEAQLAKNPAIKSEEAGQYIMNYINKAEARKAAVAAEEGLAKANEYLAKVDAEVAGIQKTESGLRYTIASQGDGAKVTSTDTVIVKYTLYDYADGILDSGDALEVNLPGGVVAGFAEGLQLLNKGGKATIWMPGSLGYGATERGTIKPNQALKFDIEIVDIKPAVVK